MRITRDRGCALSIASLATLGGALLLPQSSAAGIATRAAPGEVSSAVAPTAPIAIFDRAAVRAAYLKRLKPALAVPARWSGSTRTCAPGTPSAGTQSSTLAAINFYRSMNQLSPVRFDPARSAKAQKAALIMRANVKLSHAPRPSWKCYTQEGATAAGSSILALGAGGARAIALYMDDPGSANTAAGHRRWLLRPALTTMGSGSTSSSNVLWVFGPENGKARKTKWVSWPTPGYLPKQIEPAGRWSLSAEGAEFAKAKVSVTAIGNISGTKLKVGVYPVENGYGSNTLVWKVSGLVMPKSTNVASYLVNVTGIKIAGKATTRSYRVGLFDPEAG